MQPQRARRRAPRQLLQVPGGQQPVARGARGHAVLRAHGQPGTLPKAVGMRAQGGGGHTAKGRGTEGTGGGAGGWGGRHMVSHGGRVTHVGRHVG